MTRPFRFLRRKSVGVLLLLGMVAPGCGGGSREPMAQSALEVVPRFASLPPGGAETFVARAQGVIASGVEWSASAGSITGAGLFTAPTETGSYEIVARAGGATGSATAIVSAPGAPASFYAAASSSCAAMPLRSTGRIYHFCDCQSGAEAGCVAGNDANAGTSPSAPKRTWSAAISAFNAMNAGDTIALCKGGLWNVPAATDANGANCGYSPHAAALRNSRCAAGASLTDPANTSTCDIRDYQASWGGANRPVLYAYQSGPTHIITRDSGVATRPGGSTNGVRIVNLEFRGGNAGPNGGTYHDHYGIGFSTCNFGTDDSWLICNNTFANLRLGMYGDSKGGGMTNLNVRGNRFVMLDLDAWLGTPGSHARFDANFFDNVGGFFHPVTGNQAHTIYLAGDGTAWAQDVQVVNNEFRRSGAGGAVGVCSTPTLVGHEKYDGLLVENNIIDAGAGAIGGCWNVDFNNEVQAPFYTAYRNTIIRRNLILGSSVGIAIGSSPGVMVENNVISLTATTPAWGVGIQSPYGRAKVGDDVANNVTIRNNTIYMSGPGSGAYTGILVGTEGTGHVIANNSIYMAATGSTCFSTPLAPGAYVFVGNNACYGGTWGTTYDATTRVSSNPMFTSPPANFTPAAGSPLIGAGTAAHAATTDFTLKTRPSPPSIGAYEP